MKGVNSIEKISPLLVISYQLSVVSGGGSLEVVRRIAVGGQELSESRIFADYTDCADYRRGNGGRW